ncbi:MAG: hypothetical protein LBR89_03710 [Holosporales bacterium]|jgi:hypothetical protein|nr:hypothetical protein [Holosporales bacterium]
MKYLTHIATFSCATLMLQSSGAAADAADTPDVAVAIVDPDATVAAVAAVAADALVALDAPIVPAAPVVPAVPVAPVAAADAVVAADTADLYFTTIDLEPNLSIWNKLIDAEASSSTILKQLCNIRLDLTEAFTSVRQHNPPELLLDDQGSIVQATLLLNKRIRSWIAMRGDLQKLTDLVIDLNVGNIIGVFEQTRPSELGPIHPLLAAIKTWSLPIELDQKIAEIKASLNETNHDISNVEGQLISAIMDLAH